jgi:hypothetical protein
MRVKERLRRWDDRFEASTSGPGFAKRRTWLVPAVAVILGLAKLAGEVRLGAGIAFAVFAALLLACIPLLGRRARRMGARVRQRHR